MKTATIRSISFIHSVVAQSIDTAEQLAEVIDANLKKAADAQQLGLDQTADDALKTARQAAENSDDDQSSANLNLGGPPIGFGPATGQGENGFSGSPVFPSHTGPPIKRNTAR